MRTERQMYDLILDVARRDERVRLVGLNGSRANPNAPRDRFQDFDVVFAVTELGPFLHDDGWLAVFGERVILQKPEAMSLYPPSLGGWFSYLIQFTDVNRIDLILLPLSDLERYLHGDSQTVILLDKDGRAGELPPPSDCQYHVKRPSAAEFDDCCNEFYWVSAYVAKGLCRKELLFAAEHMGQYVRKELLRMLSWQVGTQTGFSVSVGKCCKYIRPYLSPEDWDALLHTYRLDTPEGCWDALYTAYGLFEKSARLVAKRLAYAYPEYGERVTAYVDGLRREWDNKGKGRE